MNSCTLYMQLMAGFDSRFFHCSTRWVTKTGWGWNLCSSKKGHMWPQRCTPPTAADGHKPKIQPKTLPSYHNQTVSSNNIYPLPLPFPLYILMRVWCRQWEIIKFCYNIWDLNEYLGDILCGLNLQISIIRNMRE